MSDETTKGRRFPQVAQIEQAIAMFPAERLDWPGMVDTLLRVIDVQESEIAGWKNAPLNTAASLQKAQADIGRQREKLARDKKAFVKRQRLARERRVSLHDALWYWRNVTRGVMSVEALAETHNVRPEAVRRFVARGRAAFRAGLERADD